MFTASICLPKKSRGFETIPALDYNVADCQCYYATRPAKQEPSEGLPAPIALGICAFSRKVHKAEGFSSCRCGNLHHSRTRLMTATLDREWHHDSSDTERAFLIRSLPFGWFLAGAY